MKLSLEDGKFLIKLARNTITFYLKENNTKRDLIRSNKSISSRFVTQKPTKYPDKFNEKMGVFVTLSTYPDPELRGCIGYPEPTSSLIDAVMDSSISAATRDPRFPSLFPEELDKIVIELTILTPPKLIQVKDPKEYLEKIEIGKDGLIAELGFNKGLLLPQVPIEWNWNKEEFLSHACNKAGLPMDAWKDPEIKIYKFQGKIFAEKEPSGEVEEKKFTK